MTRKEIEKEAEDYVIWHVEQRCFIAGAMFILRTQLEKKRDAYIQRTEDEPDHKDFEYWNLQIYLLNKKIEEL